MGFKFTIEDNIERVITHNTQNNEVVVLDCFKGFNVVEVEDDNNVFLLYFKDVNRNLEVVQRYFKVEKNRLTNIKKNFFEYEENPTERYLKLMDYKNLSTSKDKSEEIYLINEDFFISCNITNKEWLQFSGFIN